MNNIHVYDEQFDFDSYTLSTTLEKGCQYF